MSTHNLFFSLWPTRQISNRHSENPTLWCLLYSIRVNWSFIKLKRLEIVICVCTMGFLQFIKLYVSYKCISHYNLLKNAHTLLPIYWNITYKVYTTNSDNVRYLKFDSRSIHYNTKTNNKRLVLLNTNL